MSKQNLEKALTLVVPNSSTRGMYFNEVEKLMQSYGILERAKTDFLSRKISFEEYLELCEMHNVNVDSYLEIIEHNLIDLRVI